MSILEDLSTLSPRKLEKRLAQLVKEALPCIEIWPEDASRENGLTVALLVDVRLRPEVADLGRVLQTEPRALLTVGWAVQVGRGARGLDVLLLRVDLERPVGCQFAIRIDVARRGGEAMRASLPLLLAASRFAIVTDDDSRPALWFGAPQVRDSVATLMEFAPADLTL